MTAPSPSQSFPAGIPPRASRLRSATAAAPATADRVPLAEPEMSADGSPGSGHSRTLQTPRRGQVRATLSLGAGMLLALCWLGWLGPTLGAWWNQQQAQYVYGTARVSQLDVVVRGQVHHFLGQDWHGTILVVEITAPVSASGPGSAVAGAGAVRLCTFPQVVQEAPGDPPRVVTLQVQPSSGSRQAPVILVRVDGVPFQLVCHLTARVPDEPASAMQVPGPGARRSDLPAGSSGVGNG
ncbi:hypothetical protein [Thermogemmatispora carboxidivorans]|uniref:hypothetical protein n=1 Tax=Thermogemmatispora carboxidivorans TaxID=1382306 RepID=UPI00069AA3B1|nr:hypothetical protein [Thermogemmatispora carboxidivorans]